MKYLIFLLIPTLALADAQEDAIRDLLREALQNRAVIAEAYRQESQAKTDYLRHLESQDVYDRIRAGRYGYVIPPNGIYVNPQNTMRVDNPVSGFNDNLLERLYK